MVPPQANVSLFSKDIRDLARKLSYTDPITFGLLNCYGVVRKVDSTTRRPTSFCFVFRTPEGMSDPCSLRGSLISSDADHSLSDRFKMAKELAKSVSGIHTYGFVHKNIRPETILTFRDGNSSLGSSFLLGFENIRTADGRTLRFGDSSWERNLYRHPRRQGLKSEIDYVMQHDIYSLGVCLLEVGLWKSFVIYDQEGMNPSPSPILGLTLESFEDKGSLIKDQLISLARNLLPRCMGNRYAQIVETCLTCLDEDNADFGDEREFQDADGILVAVRYIEKVSSHSSP
jgi:serine/threonine protein kinase